MSSEEVGFQVAELEGTLEAAGRLLAQVEVTPQSFEREEKIRELDRLLKRAKKHYKIIDLETRILATSERNYWKGQLKAIWKKIQEYSTDHTWAERAYTAQADGNNNFGNRFVTEENLISHGDELMKKADESAAHTIRILHETKEVGIVTGNRLKMQSEQIQRVSDEAYEIEDQLARANQILKRMYRRTKTDKYLWMLVILIVMSIIGIVIMQIASPGDSKNAGDQLKNV